MNAANAICRRCGCIESDCTGCVERTGRPCYWVEHDLCSACTPRFEVLGLVVFTRPLTSPWPGGWVYVVCVPGGDPEEFVGPPGQHVNHLVELGLEPGLWAIARRLLPRLAKMGRLSL